LAAKREHDKVVTANQAYLTFGFSANWMDKSSLPLAGLDPDTNSMNRIAWQMISACVGGGEGRCWFGAGARRLVKMYFVVEQLLPIVLFAPTCRPIAFWITGCKRQWPELIGGRYASFFCRVVSFCCATYFLLRGLASKTCERPHSNELAIGHLLSLPPVFHSVDDLNELP
jgi:hypothetical protein